MQALITTVLVSQVCCVHLAIGRPGSLLPLTVYLSLIHISIAQAFKTDMLHNSTIYGIRHEKPSPLFSMRRSVIGNPCRFDFNFSLCSFIFLFLSTENKMLFISDPIVLPFRTFFHTRKKYIISTCCTVVSTQD